MNFVTPQKVLEMTYVDFRDQYLRKKGEGSHLRSRIEGHFFDIVVTNIDITPTQKRTLCDILQQMLTEFPPRKLLSYKQVGVTQVKTLLEVLEGAGVILSDLPEYKAWYKEHATKAKGAP